MDLCCPALQIVWKMKREVSSLMSKYVAIPTYQVESSEKKGAFSKGSLTTPWLKQHMVKRAIKISLVFGKQPPKKKKSIENLRKKKEEKNFQRPYLRGINSWNRSPNWASKPWQKGRCTNLKDHQLVLRSEKSFHRRQVVDFLLTPKSGDSKNLEKVMSNWRSSPILEEESDKNGMKPSQSTSSFAVNPSERFRNSENSHYPTNSMYTLIHAFITVHYSPLLQWLQFSIPFYQGISTLPYFTIIHFNWSMSLHPHHIFVLKSS